MTLRRVVLVFTVLLTLATPLMAQSARPSPLVHWGKWGAAGLSLGLHLLAISAHNRSDRTLRTLTANCFDTPAACDIGSDGAYVDPRSEAQFQSVLSDNRKARAYLITGEVALLGTVVLFVSDLTRKKAHPPNKPFNPEIAPGPNGTTHVGFRLEF